MTISVVLIWWHSMSLVSSPQPQVPCQLCLSRGRGPQAPRPVYHRHYSSRADRALGGLFYCLGCKRPHSAEVDGRLRVCVSASALHEFWGPRNPSVLYRGSPFHVDYLSIPGSSILDLMTVFRQEYGEVSQPLDVVLVGYLQLLLSLSSLISGCRSQRSSAPS